MLQSESYTKELQIGAINLSINEPATLDKISIYPNPSKGIFVVDIPAKLISPKEIIVYTLTGQQVYTIQGSVERTEQYTLDLSSQSEGTYIVMIKGEDRVEVQRVVISQ